MSRRPPRRPPQPPPGATLAAELALGVLDAAERAAAEARSADDADFAAEAAAWSARLHPLTEGVAPVDPPAELWAGIEAALPAAQAAGRGSFAAGLDDAPAAAAATAGSRLRRWRLLAAGMTVVALACVSALAITLGRQPASAPLLPTPLLSARLTPPADSPVLTAGDALYTVTVDRAHGTAVLTPVNPGPSDPRARELWVLPKDGGPVSLGPVSKTRPTRVRLGDGRVRLTREGAVLSVTLEPEGGAPGDAPTGPVVASGLLSRI